MKKRSHIFKILSLLVCLSTIPAISYGHHHHPGGPPAGAPIDGGLSILLIAGIGYGAKKIAAGKREKI